MIFPPDIFAIIFTSLDTGTLITMMRVCKKFREIALVPGLWKGRTIFPLPTTYDITAHPLYKMDGITFDISKMEAYFIREIKVMMGRPITYSLEDIMGSVCNECTKFHKVKRCHTCCKEKCSKK